MNKKLLINLIWPIILICLFIWIKPGAEAYWASFRDFTNPHYFKDVEKKWSGESSDFLISKLGHPSYVYDGVAVVILAKRKNLSSEQLNQIKKYVESNHNYRRRVSSLSLLFGLDSERATGLSMKILESGKDHPLYSDALGHLSHRQYAPAYPYVVELAKAPEKFNNGSISLLEKFNKPESIPILEDMLKHVKHKDPVVAGLYRDTIQDAIRSIKEKNNIPA